MVVMEIDGFEWWQKYNDTEQQLQPKLQPALRQNLKPTIVKDSKLVHLRGEKCILLNEHHCLFMMIETVMEIVGFEWWWKQ